MMNPTNQQLILEAAAASTAGRIHFGQVIAQLVQAGVESYHVDYRAGRSTYYFPVGEAFTVDHPASHEAIPEAFDDQAIQAAICQAQQGVMMYPEFRRVSQSAGCASYTVWIAGRHVSYYGRKGEVHREPFPS